MPLTGSIGIRNLEFSTVSTWKTWRVITTTFHILKQCPEINTRRRMLIMLWTKHHHTNACKKTLSHRVVRGRGLITMRLLRTCGTLARLDSRHTFQIAFMLWCFCCEHFTISGCWRASLIIRQFIREIEGCRPQPYHVQQSMPPACAHLKVMGVIKIPVPRLAVSISTGATTKYHAGFSQVLNLRQPLLDGFTSRLADSYHAVFSRRKTASSQNGDHSHHYLHTLQPAALHENQHEKKYPEFSHSSHTPRRYHHFYHPTAYMCKQDGKWLCPRIFTIYLVCG